MATVTTKKEDLLSPRVKKEKEELLAAPPQIDTERVEILLDQYRNDGLDPIIIRRAKVFHRLMSDGSHFLYGYDLTDFLAGRKAFVVAFMGVSIPLLVTVLLLGFFIRRSLLGQIDALLEREERPLAAAVGDTDDQLVEHQGRAPHQVLVPACERIECSRVDCPSRHVSPNWSPKCSAPARRGRA